MWNPNTAHHPRIAEEFKLAASSLAVEFYFVSVRTVAQLPPAVMKAHQAHVQALYVIDDAFFYDQRDTLLALASKARLPVIYGAKEFVEQAG
jgi:ABC-type uncharacterized transport system substrate-binding protein